MLAIKLHKFIDGQFDSINHVFFYISYKKEIGDTEGDCRVGQENNRIRCANSLKYVTFTS